jgi:glycosyltransferase involved in cell wall biosynthesis
MKKALWITNKNEWDRKIKLDLPYQRPEGIMSFPPTISVYRSNLQHAVSLLWRTGQLDLFDKLILTNDGSTDNTFLIMQQIQQALGSDKVIIAGDDHNQGKWVRYIEAMDIAQEHGMDIVVSTDADMTDPWNMLPELIQHMEQNRSTLFHVICPMYETNEIACLNCTNGPGQTSLYKLNQGDTSQRASETPKLYERRNRNSHALMKILTGACVKLSFLRTLRHIACHTKYSIPNLPERI